MTRRRNPSPGLKRLKAATRGAKEQNMAESPIEKIIRESELRELGQAIYMESFNQIVTCGKCGASTKIEAAWHPFGFVCRECYDAWRKS
jgi:hypothetical protein